VTLCSKCAVKIINKPNIKHVSTLPVPVKEF